MNEIGSKFINGKMVNLDKESIENLEAMAQKVQEDENVKREKLDYVLNRMLNE